MNGQLADLIERIIEKKKSTQAKLGADLKPPKRQSQLSKIANGTDWQEVSAKVLPLPEKDDIVRKLQTELGALRDKVSRHADQKRRLREEITEEIRIWSDLLERDQQVTYDYIKRRISALKGSLEYPGIVGFEAMEER